MIRNRVILVFGDEVSTRQVTELAARGFVWLAFSRSNRATAATVWGRMPQSDLDGMLVSINTSPEDLSSRATLESWLEDILEHFPGISEIEVFAFADSAASDAALRGRGFEPRPLPGAEGYSYVRRGDHAISHG